MREWKTWHEIARVENAGVENAAPDETGGKRGSGKRGSRMCFGGKLRNKWT